MNRELVAPCGMNCSVCSAYLAYINNLPKKRGKITHCMGCRPKNKLCACLKGHCDLLRTNEVEYCFECQQYPCRRLLHLDDRYRSGFGVSPIENLEQIRTKGIEEFLRQEVRRYSCRKCGEPLSMHNKRCFCCEKIVSARA